MYQDSDFLRHSALELYTRFFQVGLDYTEQYIVTTADVTLQSLPLKCIPRKDSVPVQILWGDISGEGRSCNRTPAFIDQYLSYTVSSM